MKRENVYEVFPVESVYGVIQVKSRLNKKEIKEGLENLASFKRLDKKHDTPNGLVFFHEDRAERGFGILFAYDSDLEWLDIIREIELFANEHPNRVWCNGVFILNRGFFLHDGKLENTDIEAVQKLKMSGFPDRNSQCLYQFYSVLLSLLRKTSTESADVGSYFQLPLIANEYSYRFCMGYFAEFATCEKHGDYQRKIAPNQLANLMDWCRTTEPMNWIRATDIAYGMPGDNTEAYLRQPGDVRIYNPENLLLSDILVRDTKLGEKIVKGLAFDAIQCADMTIFIPYYYSAKEQIIAGCPKCKP